MNADLIGRTNTIHQIVADLDRTNLAAITVLTGPTGIGRSAVLAEVAHQAASRGLVTLRITLSRHDLTSPFYLSSRLASALSRLPAEVRAPVATAGSADATEQVTAELARMILARPGLVILIDDVQWVDAPSRAVLDLLVRRLSRARVRWVCALRTPVRRRPHADLDRLVADGLARLVPLSPLSREASDTLVANLIQARPHTGLGNRVRRLSRGVPAAILAAIYGYQRAGSLLIADGYGYLLHPSWPSDLPPEHPLPVRLGELPAPAWTVAKAMAVLHPLRAQAPRVIAETLGLDALEIADALELLVDEGVLRAQPGGRGWQFTVPLWAEVFDHALGPYERRQLAQAVVTATWARTAHPRDARFRAEQLLRCSQYGEPRLFSESFQLGVVAINHDTWSAARWLGAAAEFAADSRQRWSTLVAHATASCQLGDFAAAARSTELLLHAPAADLPPGAALEVQLVHVIALWGLRDTDAVRRIAEGKQQLGQDPAHDAATRSAALCLLGSWDEAYQRLTEARRTWTAEQDSNGLAKIVLAVAGALTGRPGHFRDLLAQATGRRPASRSHTILVLVATRLLLALGDTRGSERLLDCAGLPSAQLAALDQALLAWQRGHWDEALHHGRMGAHPAGSGQPGLSVLQHAVSSIMLGRGRPAEARAALAAARRAPGLMEHLLDAVDAAIARIFGDLQAAWEHVSHGIAYAARHAIVAHTEDLWLHAAKLAVARGDVDRARWAVRGAAQVAEIQQADRSRLFELLTRLTVERDAAAAREALSLARRVGQPEILARTLIATVEAGHGGTAMLGEAYDLFDGLHALLYRYRLRQLMRTHNMRVPRRAVTTAENDRLLATLIADGASNREVAAVLQTSIKGVEGMLTRLFARSGFHSRVDLVTAAFAGEYAME